jgi:hypothetical protein
VRIVLQVRDPLVLVAELPLYGLVAGQNAEVSPIEAAHKQVIDSRFETGFAMEDADRLPHAR